MKRENNQSILQCTYCGSTRVRKSTPQGFVEKIFFPLRKLHPYHCIDCYKRFYSRSQMIRPEYQEPEIVPHAPPQPAPMKRTDERKSLPRTNQVERRGFSRVASAIPARLVASPGYRVNGTVRVISLNGCFFETSQIAPAGSVVDLMLDIGEGTQVRALVRRSVAVTGMGLEFTDMTVPNFRRLQSIARDSVRLQAEL